MSTFTDTYIFRVFEVSLRSLLLQAIYAPPSFHGSMTLRCQTVARQVFFNSRFLDYALVAEAPLRYFSLLPALSILSTPSKTPVPIIPMSDSQTSPEALLLVPVA